MVDMPHIWFGSEADGYEFPRADGAVGQTQQAAVIDSAAVTANSAQTAATSISGYLADNPLLWFAACHNRQEWQL